MSRVQLNLNLSFVWLKEKHDKVKRISCILLHFNNNWFCCAETHYHGDSQVEFRGYDIIALMSVSVSVTVTQKKQQLSSYALFCSFFIFICTTLKASIHSFFIFIKSLTHWKEKQLRKSTIRVEWLRISCFVLKQWNVCLWKNVLHLRAHTEN